MWPFSLASLARCHVFLVRPCDASVVHFFSWLSAPLVCGHMTFGVSTHRRGPFGLSPLLGCHDAAAAAAQSGTVSVLPGIVYLVWKNACSTSCPFLNWVLSTLLLGCRSTVWLPPLLPGPLSWWPFKQPPLYCRPALDHNGVCLRRDNGPLLGVALLVHEWY